MTLWCRCVSMECIIEGKNCKFSELVEDNNKQIGLKFVGFDVYNLKRDLSGLLSKSYINLAA